MLQNGCGQVCLMGMFHWSRPVGNDVFLMGQEQCLQSRLGSVLVSQFVVVDQQNIKHF